MAEQIVNEIIVDISKAINPLKQLDAQFDKHTAALKKAAIGESQFNVSARGVIATQKKQASAVRESTAAVKEAAKAARAAAAAAKKHAAELRKQALAAKDLGISWKSVKRIFTGQVIFRVLSAITNQMRDSVSEAKELGIKLAEALTIAPGTLSGTIEGVIQLRKEVKLLSESFGIDQIELASAAYQVYSNQIGNASESTRFLEQAVLLATATVTSASNAVDILSGIINAYGLEADDAARISDILTKSVELGRFRVDEIASSFGRLTPLASTLGISIAELFAAFDTLTIKGVSADKAITQLLALMLKLTKPSKELTEALKQTGFVSIEQAIAVKGLVGVLLDVNKTTDGTVEALGKLFPRVRALQGVIGLTSDAGERFNSIFTEIQDTAQGTTQRFADFINATEAKELDRNIQAIKNLFIDEFGVRVVSAINDVIESLGGIPEAANKTIFALKVLGAAVLALVVKTAIPRLILLLNTIQLEMALATTRTEIFSLVLNRIPFVILAAGAVLLGQGVAKLFDELFIGVAKAERAQEAMEALEQQTKDLATTFANASNKALNALTVGAIEGLKVMTQSVQDQIILQQDLGNEIEFIQNQVTGNLVNQLSTRLKAFEDFARDSANALELANKDVAKIDDSIAKIKSRTEQELFDLRIRNLSQWQQEVARARRANELLQRAAITTDKEERAELLRTAAAEASRAKSPTLIAKVAKLRITNLEVERNAILRNAKILDSMAAFIQNSVDKMKLLNLEAIKLKNELKEIGLTDSKASLIKFERLETVTGQFQGIQRSLEDALGRAFGVSITSFRKGVDLAFVDPIQLSFQFKDLRARVIAIQKLRVIPEELEIAARNANLIGLPQGRVSPEELLKSIGLTRESLEAAKVLAEKVIVINLSAAITNARQAVLEGTKELEAAIGANIFAFGPFGDPEIVKGFEDRAKTLRDFAEGLNALNAVGEAKNIELISEVLNKLKDTAISIEDNGVIKTFKDLESVIQPLKNIKLKFDILDDLDKGAKKAKDATNELSKATPAAAQGLIDIAISAAQGATQAKNLSTAERAIGPAAQAGASLAVSALNRIGPSASNQIASVNALADALANLAAQRQAAAVTAATGGQIPAFLAAGGPTQSRGTDTVPVQAAPGEFFVNAASSRRFIPELTAINQGRAPEPRNNAQTTNNSFSGDININVPPGSTVDGRTIARDIRRELRRKTSSLS